MRRRNAQQQRSSYTTFGHFSGDGADNVNAKYFFDAGEPAPLPIFVSRALDEVELFVSVGTTPAQKTRFCYESVIRVKNVHGKIRAVGGNMGGRIA